MAAKKKKIKKPFRKIQKGFVFLIHSPFRGLGGLNSF